MEIMRFSLDELAKTKQKMSNCVSKVKQWHGNEYSQNIQQDFKMKLWRLQRPVQP